MRLLYPWSAMDDNVLKALTKSDVRMGPTVGRDIARKIMGDAWVDSRRESGWDQAVCRTLEAMARWLHGPKRLIDVSKMAHNKLRLYPPRFASLAVGNASTPWNEGAMFVFGDFIVYMEPSVGLSSLAAMWAYEAPGSWATVILDDSPKLGSHLHTYTILDHALQPNRLAIAPDQSRTPVGWLLHGAVNALAALAERPEVVVGLRRRPTRHDRAGRVDRVRRVTLTDDALATITRCWVVTGEKGEMEAGLRSPPSLHTVAPHTTRMWVLSPGPDEVVLGSREVKTRKSTHLLYCVQRVRGRNGTYVRGGGLKPKQARLVTGYDDL